ITSSSTQSNTQLTLQFILSKSITDAATDVQAAIQRATGILACSSGNNAFTEFATSTAFAPACRETARTTIDPGGLNPRIQKKRDVRSSCTPCRTWATSRR